MPADEIMALFVLRKLLLQTHMRRHPVGLDLCLIFGRSLRLLPYFMCANSEGYDETARMRRLARAFAGRLCDKYRNLMSWLKCARLNILYCIFKPAEQWGWATSSHNISYGPSSTNTYKVLSSHMVVWN